MRRLLILSLIIILAFANTTFGAQSIEAQLKKIVDETRKTLPKDIDDGIQATNIGSSGKTLINYYNFTRQKTDLYDVHGVIANYRRNSLDTACTNPGTRSFIFGHGGAIQYQFYDSANSFVGKFTINSETCKAR